MIQRKQTLWLLLSTVCSGLTFKFPFYSGTVAPGVENVTGPELSAVDNIPLIALTAVIVILSAVTIFLFKDRRKQIQFSILGLLMSIGLIALYWSYTSSFATGNIAITAILTLFILIGFFFAISGIRKDQKLIKDLNRLR
ncbi:DUF4293 domain-containing protein [Niabella ginsengisoli]|uniref:DUF4293 domain-containing protein n=1 Tax=Niabella ginsengisoli TaxID=522298 RepID=A0ABS9SI79_9BACT|nr:DUF4293 domain-containing protein [Niabella ginsengisoli]MCH5598088.1 DUF4293 domain-containing protein [Niabella ginsengisoli]